MNATSDGANAVITVEQVLEVGAEEEAEGLAYLDLLTAHPSETESAEAGQPAPKPEAPAKAAQNQVGVYGCDVTHWTSR